MKYKVGDLLSAGYHTYLIEDVKADKYWIRQTSSGFLTYWFIHHADNDRHLKKVN